MLASSACLRFRLPRPASPAVPSPCFHCFPCVSTAFHVFPLLSMCFHCFPCVSTAFHGFPLLSMCFHCFPWVSTSPLVSMSCFQACLRWNPGPLEPCPTSGWEEVCRSRPIRTCPCHNMSMLPPETLLLSGHSPYTLPVHPLTRSCRPGKLIARGPAGLLPLARARARAGAGLGNARSGGGQGSRERGD